MLDALIFDFDGIILDTETPLFDAWHRTFEHFGVEPIGLDEWCRSLGLADDDPNLLDPVTRLCEQVGHDLDQARIQATRRRLRNDALRSTPLQPGVIELLDAAARRGLPVAIASSAPNAWIDRHLAERHLDDRFSTRSCAGDGVPGKPDPAVYNRAATMLNVDPARCLALEDSPNGVAAAKRAGMRCIAVPTGVSRGLDLSAADQTLTTLLEVDLDEW